VKSQSWPNYHTAQTCGNQSCHLSQTTNPLPFLPQPLVPISAFTFC
jgi:hypothetical protein